MDTATQDRSDAGVKPATKQTRTSNEQILDAITALNDQIGSIKKDIEELKIKTGANDKPVMPPMKKNYNNDCGPFGNQLIQS